MPNRGQVNQDFTVPSGSGSYATEIVYAKNNDPTTIPALYGKFARVNEYQIVVEALPATAQIEIDLLLVGQDPATAANWNNHKVYTAVGVYAVEVLLNQAMRVRAKSGGSSGTATVGLSWSE